MSSNSLKKPNRKTKERKERFLFNHRIPEAQVLGTLLFFEEDYYDFYSRGKIGHHNTEQNSVSLYSVSNPVSHWLQKTLRYVSCYGLGKNSFHRYHLIATPYHINDLYLLKKINMEGLQDFLEKYNKYQSI